MDILKKAPPPQKIKIIHADEYGFFIRVIMRYGKEKNIDFLEAVNILFLIAILIEIVALAAVFYPNAPRNVIDTPTLEKQEHGQPNHPPPQNP